MKAKVRQENEKIKIKKDERIGSIWIYKKDPKNLKKIFDPVSSQSKKEAHVNLEDEKTSSKAGSKLIPTTRYELNGFFFVLEGMAFQRWTTYTGEESLLIRVSPVVDTALEFRGQLDFRLVNDTGQQA